MRSLLVRRSMSKYKVRVKKLEKEIDVRADRKYCPKCGVYKNKDEFNKDSTRKDGLQVWCKKCLSEHRKKKTLQPEKSRKVPCTTKQFYDRYYSEGWIKD